MRFTHSLRYADDMAETRPSHVARVSVARQSGQSRKLRSTTLTKKSKSGVRRDRETGGRIDNRWAYSVTKDAIFKDPDFTFRLTSREPRVSRLDVGAGARGTQNPIVEGTSTCRH